MYFSDGKKSAPSGSRQPSSNGCRVSWRVCQKSGSKRTRTHGTYHGQAQTLCTPSQLQRVAMSAPCRQEYSHRPCCSTLTNASGPHTMLCCTWHLNAQCASIIFFTTPSCRMHWSTCCTESCMSTPNGRGHSWPLSAVGKVYREFALDHGMCHAFLYACTQIFCRPSNSICDHSMRATENRKARIPFCAKISAERSGVSRWLLIRSRASLAFHVLPLLWRSCHHSSCPSNLGTSTRHSCLAILDVRHLSSDLVPECFPFAFEPCQLQASKFF